MRDDLAARTRAALAAHALSMCEHFVMWRAGDRLDVDPARMIRAAGELAAGDPRGTFTEADYTAALASCIQRGLLRVLDATDFDRDGHRTHLRDSPLVTEEGFRDYRPGHVDFTAEGYVLHQAVVGLFVQPR